MTEPAIWSEVRPATMAGLLRARAAERPERVAFTFLADGEVEAARLTYAELDRRARTIAARLRESVAPGERALLLYPPGLEFIAAFFGCLYAGVVAVPAYPPRLRDRSHARLRSIARDAEPRAALTTEAILNGLATAEEGLAARAPELADMLWLPTDTLPSMETGGPELPEPDPESVAFLQYTSGSTSTPKGVMVTNANLLHNERMIGEAFGQDEDSVVVGWLPLYHDMGLIGNVLQPLHAGATCVLMAPVAFLQKPLRWLAAISRYRATTSGGPNFAYDLCARRIGPEERAELDLSSWRVAFNGAEPVREETLARFAEAFASSGFRREAFYPCYGLAEATLFVTGGVHGRPPRVEAVDAAALERHEAAPAVPGAEGRRLVGSGRPWLDQRVVIADPETGAELPPGRVGEIWVSGPSVARGYWRNPEATGRDFQAALTALAGPSGDIQGPFLRTGDLGFLQDGELFVTGRIKDLVIIRGRNHYPQDLELTAERSHPDLRPGSGAAFSVDVDGEERLVVVQEVERRPRDPVETIAEAVRRAVAEEHEVQVHEVVLVRAGTVPKTSSGKIQRHACRASYLADELAVVGRSALVLEPAPLAGEEAAAPISRAVLAALDPSERRVPLLAWLRQSAARFLGAPAASIDPEQPLTGLGLDSLAAVELKTGVETALGVQVPLADLLQGAGLGEMADRILVELEAGPAEEARPVVPRPAEGDQPLSFGQKSLWFLDRLAPEGGAYNIAVAARVLGGLDVLDVEALRRSLAALTARHAALRTVFQRVDDEPVQRVLEEMEVDLAVGDIGDLGEEAFRPFALERGPLLRVRVSGDVLLFVIHHIVTDFWSLAVLARELSALYRQETGGPTRKSAELEPLALRYTDYVHWQAERLSGEHGERLWGYWRERLAGLSDLDLPTDRPRPPVQTYAGGARALALPPALADRLRSLAAGHGATLYIALLAAFQAQLGRYAGQDDVAVGSPTAGRGAPELAGLAGYFVNPVVMRSDLSGEPSFAAFLGRVRGAALSALEHADFPFALLAERLRPVRDPARSPLFQAMLVLQRGRPGDDPGLAAFSLGEAGARIELGGLALESLVLPERRAQFDLTLRLVETAGGGLGAVLEHNADLFDGATAERILGHLQVLLEGATADPRTPLPLLPLLTRSESGQVLSEWNATRREYPQDVCLHELFEAQVERTPRAEALAAGDLRLTYAELNARANRLADHLRSMGVGPEVRVGVCLDRSADLVVSLLSVLKAGGAYVPLDPTYPTERLEMMLEDSGAKVLVARPHPPAPSPATPLLFPGEGVTRVELPWDDTGWSAENLPPLAGPRNLAYFIYTSGSTGRPKAVAIEHRSPVVLAHWAREVFSPEELSGVLASTSVGFDLSVFEIFVPLSWGGRVIVAENALELPRIPARDEVTLINTVPSAMAELARGKALPSSLLTVNLAGEPIPPALVTAVQAGPARRLYNLYGPSEDTTYSTFALLDRGSEAPIGRPLANTRVYLLDRYGQPVPVGVPGELYLGGDGLARGYFARPDLTAERFVPDPFGGEPGARLYRTGDLARWRPRLFEDATLDFLGRIDHQVKVRGFRIELGEVEAALARHPGVREAVVLARPEGDGGKRLVAYLVPRGAEVPGPEIRAFLRGSLPEYMVPSALVTLGALPLSPNGKVDRKALARIEPARPRGGEAEGLRDAVEEVLAGLVAETLGLERVGPHDNFFELGGHSLLATRVLARVSRLFGVDLPVSSLFLAPTVAGLAERVRAAGSAVPAPPILPVPRPEGVGLPLSFPQYRLWFLDRLEPGHATYNLPGVVRLAGPLDLGALAAALGEVVRRHEVLRTVFRTSGEGPVQRVDPIGPFTPAALPLDDLTALPAAERAAEADRLSREEAARPFDLARGPLCRARVLRLDAGEHRLLVTLHHTVADGWSLGIFLRELAALYRAFSEGAPSPLPELPVQYADFAVWQREWMRGEVLEAQLEYWRWQLADLPVLELPLDRPRPAVRGLLGGVRSLPLLDGLPAAIGRVARQRGATRFMALLAAFQTLLARYTGEASVPVGSPVANRQRPEVEDLIGFFANTLVLRARLGGDPPFGVLLERVRDVCLDAYAHQDLPFERLVEELRPERDLSQTPLFQVMLVLDEPLPGMAVGPLAFEPGRAETGTAKFDLTLTLTPEGDGLTASLEYDAALFEPATVERMLGHWRTLLDGVVADPAAPVFALPLLSAAERAQALKEWNATAADFPRGLRLHELFEAQARRTPEAEALVAGNERLTYAELDGRAGRLAARLRELGVGPEVRVGVCLERSADLVVSLLAVLKAGGAYVPLDPAYPHERLEFMLADSGASVLVSREGVSPHPPAPSPAPPPSAPGEGERNLAYLIYTSGSTGRPKGVAIEHRSAVTFAFWAREVFSDEELAGVLASTSVCFDLSVFELFVPLAWGGKVILAANALELPSLPAAGEVTLVNTVPSAMAELVRGGRLPASLRTVNLAGEPLQRTLVQRIYEAGVGSVYNLYGPSEDTTYSTFTRIDPGEGAPPIGKPIANTRAYVLDARAPWHAAPVPAGVAGELYLGGEGLARGYLGRPDLTAERFVPDPFGPHEGRSGERLYRTGDLARRRVDGTLEFLGRIDHQVKVRGFRIELGEVESALAGHPGVREAAVVVRADGDRGPRLVAYVAPAGAVEAGAEPPEALLASLRAWLGRTLPEYMVPTAWVVLPALPLTPNGKVDRKALPVPGGEDRTAGYVAPRDATEERLAAIWREVLGVERVGVHDDFFELGGQSLLAYRVIARVAEELGTELPVAALFQAPTVARLARRLSEAPEEAAGEPEAPVPVWTPKRADYVAPRTPVEEWLAEVWAEVLGVEQVGVHDDFFELGGHSLLAHRVLAHISEELGDELPISTLFQAPTVEKLAQRLAAGSPGAGPDAAGHEPRPEEGYPPSSAQLRLWLVDRLEPWSAAYNLWVAVRFEGALDPAVLGRALAGIQRRHEPLRTVFADAGAEPVQVVLPPAEGVQVARLDFAGLEPTARERALDESLLAEALRPFDLRRGPVVRYLLVRLGEREHVLMTTFHHIAVDGWSLEVFFRELVALYGAFAEGRPSPLPELPVRYVDHALRQRRALEGEALRQQLAWWRRQLAGVPVLELPADRPRLPARSYQGATLRFDLEPRRTEALRALGRAEGGTLFMVLLAGFAALLSRYSGQDDFAVGTPVAGRNRLDVEGLIGLFINTLVLRTGTENDPSFRELLARLRDTVLAAQGHQDVPFERLVEELHPDRSSGHSPLFQVLFAFMSRPAGRLEIPGLALTLVDVEAPVSKFDLTLAFQEYPERLTGWLEYRTDLFEAATIERMEGHLLNLLAGAVEEPGRSLGELPMLSSAERRQLLEEWSVDAALNCGRLVHASFEKRARLAPGLPAVVHGVEALTYGDLNLKANRLARHLRGLGVGPGVPVAGCLERSLDLVVTLLAVLKAGGAWLPLDPAYPRERLEMLLTDSGAAVMVARRDLAAGVDLAGLGTAWPVWLDEERDAIEAQDGSDLAPAAGPLDVAYLIYTSGSTGRPKGVAVPHGAAAAHFDAVSRLYGIGEGDRVLQFASFSFDVSLEQVFAPLGAGATVVLRGPELWGTGDLLERLAGLGLTHVNLPTAYWHRWVRDLAPWAEPPASLRLLIVGGEEMLGEAARLWLRSPLAGVRLLNAYGPTETVVTSTLYEIGRAEKEGEGLSVPVGQPTPGRTAYVLDRQGRLVPAGVPGELCLGGLLARGYPGRPDLTAERFVPDPFGVPGERLYRTGDLVRRRPGGELEFLGRLDTQVKVRGFRIEPGEIESALLAHPAVREAVVLALADSGERRLAAYVVGSPERPLSVAELSAFLSARLPSYMVPASFTLLEELPLTPHGKVDRQALPRPVFERGTGGEEAPRGTSQELLAGIWTELLGVGRVGPRDSFFDLGGHSLLATQLASRVRAVFGVDVPLSALFEAPSLAQFAARIDEALRGPVAAPPAPPILPAGLGAEGAPLSFAQQRLWFLDRLEPDSPAYTVPGAARLRGPLRLEALAAALAGIVRRHESQRTVFVARGSDPVQVVLPPPDSYPLPVVDLAGLGVPEPEAMRLLGLEARRPFDLDAGPLLRAVLLRLAPEDHLLGVMSHHIVSDAWSLGLMLRELAALYRAALAGAAPTLPELPVQYADFAVWQRQWLAGDVLGRELAHWRDRLAGAPQTLDLPSDRPRPAVPSGRAGYRTLAMPGGFVAELRALALREGWTPFMALLAAFYALLARYSGQLDLVVGTPVANRNRLETEGLLGFFTNTLALRLDLSGDPAFRELGRRVRAAALDGQAHQDLPFERLVEDLAPERALGRTPLFQVMFVLRPGQPALDLPGVETELLSLETGATKFDLMLSLGLERGGLEGVLEFSRDLFDDATAGRLLGHFRTLLEAAVAAPETHLSELPLLTAAERQALAEWSRPSLGYPAPVCVHQPVAAQAARTPDAEAVLSGEERLTYRELLNRSRRLARRLVEMGVGPDVPVGIFLDRSPAMMVAVLGILEAGGAYLALEPGFPRERLRAMLEDARPPVVITRRGLAADAPESGARLLLVEEAGLEGPPGSDTVFEPPIPSGVTPDHVVYLVYTSGTTGRPKGIAMTHAAIGAMLVWQLRTSAYGSGRTLQFSPLSFDVSFQEAFSTWWSGGALVLISEEMRRDPLAMVRWMAEHRVDRLFLPFVALQQVAVAALAMPETDEPLVLREVMSGGEQLFVTPQVAGLFEKLPGAVLFNHFGPSEAHAITWLALQGNPRTWPERPTVGRPIDHGRIFLLDPGLQPVPAGVPGEIWVGGAGLARGYLGRPDLTAERFVPDPFQEVAGWRPGARLYRTGDLGRLLPDGTLEFLGRGDSQVKIRGYRIELGEVETAIARHPAVVQTAVAVRGETAVARRLVAYVVFRPDEPEPTPAELRSFLTRTLPDAMVPTAWVRLEALPIAPTGKVNRRALPEPEMEGEGAHVPPRDETEELIAGIWCDVLGVERIGVYDNFFDLGGHSLLATQVMSRLRGASGVEVPLRRLFEGPTVADLARAVASGTASAEETIPRVPRGGALPLSYAQNRLWFLDRLQPGGVAYSLPMQVRFSGALEVPVLAAVLTEIVRRHESLRTVFADEAGEPVQVVLPAAPWPLPLVDLSGLGGRSPAEALRLAACEVGRPFDLARGPLLRTLLVRLAPREHLLAVDMHHIISDGWSLGVMVREVTALYAAAAEGRPSPLLELPVQYADFAAWQRRWLTGEVFERLAGYWRERLAGMPAGLSLPTDRPRPAVPSLRGAVERFPLGARRTRDLVAFARRQGATPFMVLAASLAALLSRYSGQLDLTLGSAVANRNRTEIEGLVGFFVNTLVLRAEVGRAPDFLSLVSQLREVTLEAYAHQDMPFEELVQTVQPGGRDMSRSPLFQVMLALQNAPLPPLHLPGLAAAAEEPSTGTSKFDLTFSLQPQGDGLDLTLAYASDLFDRTTVLRLTGHWGRLLDGALEAPQAPLGETPLLSETEGHQLLWEWNDAEYPVPFLRVDQVIAAQAARTPDAPAVSSGGEPWTYRELARRVADLAATLRRLGVGPDGIVGIYMHRSREMVAAVLAVLEAGGAWLPLDPTYPEERLAFMLEDAGARWLLSAPGLAGRLAATGVREVVLGPDGPELPAGAEGGEEEGDRPEAGPDNLAYVIYTSGSTGRPKGVMITHGGLAVAILGRIEYFRHLEEPPMGFLMLSSFSFDMSIPPIFTSLCSGGRVIVPPPGAAEDPSQLVALPERDEITCTLVVPSHWSVLLERPELASLRVVAVAGEACPAELVERHYVQYPRARFWNEYGPTENTIWSTAQPLPPGRPEVVPIGRPRPGVRLHVLDSHGRPVPPGVAGELYIGGTSLARGYLGRPALTAQAFVPDPFGREPGGRLYRTGDLVRYQQDGAVQFLGRIDHQVKIRGFRIELGEIEAALEKAPGVREAVVVAREDIPGDKRLVGYVVSDRQPAVTPAELREDLLRTLPEYMVPWTFVPLDELPRTSNGKVDRKALPVPQAVSAGEYVAPRTDLERTIAEAWREVLRLERVGVHDNFFESGGNSLLIIKLHSRLTQVLGRELSVMDLFRHPSVDALARYLAQEQPGEAPRESGAEQARARTRTRQESMRQLSQKRAQRRPRNEG